MTNFLVENVREHNSKEREKNWLNGHHIAAQNDNIDVFRGRLRPKSQHKFLFKITNAMT